MPSLAFVRLMSFLYAASALAFSQTSRYTLGRWHHALHDPRSLCFLGIGLAADTMPIQLVAVTVSAASIGLSSWGLHVMQSIGVPNHCLCIMAAVWDRIKEISASVDIATLQDLHCVEYFCGEGAVHKGMKAYGSKRRRKCKSKYEVRGFDIRNDDVYQDLNTDFGFLSALLWLLRLVDFESLVWFGTVCSSWIWLARGSTRRTLRGPRGNLRAPSVRAGNQMVARTAFLLCVAYAKSVTWVLEQPAKSLMSAHPAIVWMGKRARSQLGLHFWSVHTLMVSFGGHTVKPHQLFGDGAWMANLQRQHPGRMESSSSSSQDITRTFIDKQGNKKCSGGKGLKSTQTYPAVAISPKSRKGQRPPEGVAVNLI